MTPIRALVPSLALALVSLLAAGSAVAEEPNEEALALELMALSGGAGVAEQTVALLAQQMRPAYPLVPEETWVEVFSAIDPDEVRGLMAQVYTRHFTREELEELIAFYQSPIGKRLVELLPIVMQDSMMAGAQWTDTKSREIVEVLRARGHNPPTFE